MNEDKKFDSVKMMREIREKLSEKYWQHPDTLKNEMDTIRKKYNLIIITTQTSPATGI